MAAGKMEVSKPLFFTLVGCLLIALVGSAFLLGRESTRGASTAVVATPTPVSVSVVTNSEPASETLESLQTERVTMANRARAQRSNPPQPRIEQEPLPVAHSNTAVSPPQTERPAETAPVAPKVVSAPKVKRPVPTAKPAAESPQAAAAQADVSPGRNDSIRRYLAQIDEITAGTTSLNDPQGFATQLLQQSLGGDNSGFDQLLQSGKAALTKLQAVNAPQACKEHHRLSVSQLRTALSLLQEVQSATTSMDTGALSALSLQGKGLERDIARLQELDRQLRAAANGG